jgi:hypothetical protein
MFVDKLVTPRATWYDENKSPEIPAELASTMDKLSTFGV